MICQEHSDLVQQPLAMSARHILSHNVARCLWIFRMNLDLDKGAEDLDLFLAKLEPRKAQKLLVREMVEGLAASCETRVGFDMFYRRIAVA